MGSAHCQAAHHLPGKYGGFAQRIDTGSIRRGGDATQTFDVTFERCEHMANDRDIDHRDSAVQRVRGTQQGFAGDSRRRFTAHEIVIDDTEMRSDFTLQDVEQDRIDVRQWSGYEFP